MSEGVHSGQSLAAPVAAYLSIFEPDALDFLGAHELECVCILGYKTPRFRCVVAERRKIERRKQIEGVVGLDCGVLGQLKR